MNSVALRLSTLEDHPVSGRGEQLARINAKQGEHRRLRLDGDLEGGDSSGVVDSRARASPRICGRNRIS